MVAGERLVFGLGVVVVVTSVFFAARNVHSYFVRPQEQELQLVRGAVKALPTGLSRVAFVRTDWTGGVTKIVRYDEFGLPSTGVVWTLEPSVLLILRDEGRLPAGPRPVVDVLTSNAPTPPVTEPVIDIRRQLLQLR